MNFLSRLLSHEHSGNPPVDLFDQMQEVISCIRNVDEASWLLYPSNYDAGGHGIFASDMITSYLVSNNLEAKSVAQYSQLNGQEKEDYRGVIVGPASSVVSTYLGRLLSPGGLSVKLPDAHFFMLDKEALHDGRVGDISLPFNVAGTDMTAHRKSMWSLDRVINQYQKNLDAESFSEGGINDKQLSNFSLFAKREFNLPDTPYTDALLARLFAAKSEVNNVQVEGRDYIVHNGVVLWYSEAALQFSPLLQQDRFVHDLICVEHGAQPGQRMDNVTPLHFDVRDFISDGSNEDRGATKHGLPKIKARVAEPSIEYMDTQSAQNNMLQSVSKTFTDGDIFVLADSESYVTALSQLPERFKVMTHEQFILLDAIEGIDAACVLNMEVPGSYCVWHRLLKVLERIDSHVVHAICQMDSRVPEIETTQYNARFAMMAASNTPANQKRFWNFWYKFWGAKFSSRRRTVMGRKSGQLRLSAFSERYQRMLNASKIQKSDLEALGVSEMVSKAGVPDDRLTPNLVWQFFLVSISKKVIRFNEESVFIRVDQTLSGDGETQDERDFAFWRRVA